jgi:hypothetical protein
MAAMTRALPYAAYLRVYEPLSAFPERERARLARYLDRGDIPDVVAGMAAEQAAGLLAALAVPPLAVPPDDADGAFVRVKDGVTYVCPWRTRLRSWLALAEFRAGMPEELVGAFVPPAIADDAENDLEKWLAAHPELRSHIRTSAWHVPLRWLCLVDPAERELITGSGATAGASTGQPSAPALRRSCRFATPMAHARRRAARALAALRKAYADGPAVGRLEDVARWLEDFHPHALVELDYGGLTQLLRDDELRDDDSADLVTAAVRALSQGDTDRATALSDRVNERWRRLRALESAN